MSFETPAEAGRVGPHSDRQAGTSPVVLDGRALSGARLGRGLLLPSGAGAATSSAPAPAARRGCCAKHSNTHWPSEGGRRCPITPVKAPLLPIAGLHGHRQHVLSTDQLMHRVSDRFVQQPPPTHQPAQGSAGLPQSQAQKSRNRGRRGCSVAQRATVSRGCSASSGESSSQESPSPGSRSSSNSTTPTPTGCALAMRCKATVSARPRLVAASGRTRQPAPRRR